MSPRTRRGGVQKADLLKWANDQQQLDMRTKAILKELASFAGEDCCAWSQVATLAWAANCVDRTVQRCLNELLAARLIEKTDRSHRLEGTTRSVPIYRIGPDVDWSGEASAMGDKMSPIDGGMGDIQASPMDGSGDGVWVTSEVGMGDIGCHPHRVQGVHRFASLTPGERARDLVEVYRQIEAAAPAAILRFNDADAALNALGRAVEEGVEVERLTAVLTWMAGHADFKSRKHPPQLHTWLAKRQYVGWLRDLDAAEAGDPEGGSAAAPVWAGPAEVREVVVSVLGEAAARTTIDRATWDAERRIIVAATTWGHQQLARCGAMLLRGGAEGMWPPPGKTSTAPSGGKT